MGTFSSVSSSSDNEDEAGPSAPKKPQGTVNIFTNKVIAALDNCKVSDRGAEVHLVAAIAETLNIDLETLTINRSSIRNYRRKYVRLEPAKLKRFFKV